MYFKYNLTKKNKYVIRFKFTREVQNFIILGLIDSLMLNSNLCSTFQGKIFG